MQQFKSALLFLLLISFISILQAQQELTITTDQWLYNIDEAKTKSTLTGNPILISFSGSDWCLPCIRLDQTLFSDSTFLQFANEALVLLKIDFPSKQKHILSQEQLRHNEAVSKLYNPKGTFPLVVIINAEGIVKGYMQYPAVSVEQYMESIREIIHQVKSEPINK